MKCFRCGEPAAMRRGDDRLCGRCAVMADWEAVARMAQGLVVRAAVAEKPAQPGQGDPPVPLAPADPFSA